MAKKPKTPKPRAPSIHDSNYDPAASALTWIVQEKRGVFEVQITPDSYHLSTLGQPAPHAGADARALLSSAVEIVAGAGHAAPATGSSPDDVERWCYSVMGSCGPVSRPALAATFIYQIRKVKADQENPAATLPEKRFSHIIQFAAAWHALKFDLSGEHAAALSGMQHAKGVKQGAGTNADRAARRDAFIGFAIEKLRQITTDATKLKRASYVARKIRDEVDSACTVDSMSASKNADAFLKVVQRFMSKSRQP